MQFHVYEDASALSEGAAEWITAYITKKLRDNPSFSLLLSGGNTPIKMYEDIAHDKVKFKINWQNINVFFGDERAVPFDDQRNNGRLAFDLLLKDSGIPHSQIHFINTNISRKESAQQYENLLRNYFSGDSHTFDLALLGIGYDGHTLSLFPGSKNVYEKTKWVITSEAPEEPVERISLTPEIVNRSACIAFLVAGKNKAGILDKIIRSRFDPDVYPAQIIKNNPENIHLFCDRDAIELVLKNTA